MDFLKRLGGFFLFLFALYSKSVLAVNTIVPPDIDTAVTPAITLTGTDTLTVNNTGLVRTTANNGTAVLLNAGTTNAVVTNNVGANITANTGASPTAVDLSGVTAGNTATLTSTGTVTGKIILPGTAAGTSVVNVAGQLGYGGTDTAASFLIGPLNSGLTSTNATVNITGALTNVGGGIFNGTLRNFAQLNVQANFTTSGAIQNTALAVTNNSTCTTQGANTNVDVTVNSGSTFALKGDFSNTNVAPVTIAPGGNFQILTGTSFTTPPTNPFTNNGTVYVNEVGSLTFPGVLTGTGRLVIDGFSQLRLSAASTYSGETKMLTGCNVDLDAANILPSTSSLIMVRVEGPLPPAAPALLAPLGPTLNLNGFDQTVADINGADVSIVTINLGSATFTFGGSNNDSVFGGIINGAGSIVKMGTGIFEASGTASNFSGGTFIQSGTLIIGANSDFSGSGAGPLGIGMVTLNGAGTAMQSTGAFTIENAYTIGASGTTINGGNDLTLSGAGTLSGALTISNSATTTLSGGMSSTGSVLQTAGTVIYNTNGNSYSGGTTLTGGTLQMAVADLMPATGALAVNGGTFDLNNNNQTVGPLSGTAGSITLGNATLTTNSSSNTTVASAMSGAGSFIKQGTGSLSLTGINAPANTTIAGGRLAINGTLTSVVSVNSAGTLGGTGTIIGNVSNDGTVTPGNSIGTLSITGDYNPTASSTTSIEINPQGQTSFLDISGTANLNGFLQIIPGAGTYQPGTLYRFLQAGVVSGRFSGNTQLVGPFLVTLVYTSNSVSALVGSATLSVTKLGPKLVNADKNEIAIANYIDSLPIPATGTDFGDNVFGPLTNLLSGQALINALESISVGKNAANVVVMQDTDMLMNSISSVRLANLRQQQNGEFDSRGAFLPAFSNTNSRNSFSEFQKSSQGFSNRNLLKQKRFNVTRNGLALEAAQQIKPMLPLLNNNTGGVWLYSFGQSTDQRQQAGNPGFDARSGGLVAGVDFGLGKDVYVGAGFGQIASLVQLDNNAGRNRVSNYLLTAYGTWAPCQWYLDASVTGGFARYRTKQNIAFLTLNRTAAGQYNGYSITPHLGVGYVIERGEDKNKLFITPFVNVDYGYVKEGSYVTSGALSLNQSVGSRYSSLLRSEAGVQLSKSYPMQVGCVNGYWMPIGTLSYVLKTPIKKGAIQSTFVGQPGFYTVEYFTGAQNLVAPGVGITFGFGNYAFVTTRIDGELGTGYKSGEASIKVGMAF